MKFAICNETFEPWTLERVCDYVSGLGYEGLELAPFTLWQDHRLPTARSCRSLRATIRASGLTTVGLHWLLARTQGFQLTSREPQIRQRTADYLRQLIGVCAELGGNILVLGSPQQRRIPEGMTRSLAREFAVEVIQSLTPALEESGTTLAIEPLSTRECNFLNSAAEAMELVHLVGHANVRLHLDCRAMCDERRPLHEILAQHQPALVHVHANDPNGRGPGMGDLNFLPILAALRAGGYTGWVSVEVFDLSLGAEFTAHRSLEYLRECERLLEAS